MNVEKRRVVMTGVGAVTPLGSTAEEIWEAICKGGSGIGAITHDVMIAGGMEALITPLAVAAFSSMKALSTRNDDPKRASRPLDRGRDGFIMGEGAGIGYGMTGDAFHMTMPDPGAQGVARCIKMALADANVRLVEVNDINARGTSTPYNDKHETLAIKQVFGGHAYRLAVSSTKPMTGHLLRAAGRIEAMFTVLAIYHGILSPTLNHEYPDPECDLDYVPDYARYQQVKVALSNSFGCGATRAVLVFKE